jgi:hypothetical protein
MTQKRADYGYGGDLEQGTGRHGHGNGHGEG